MHYAVSPQPAISPYVHGMNSNAAWILLEYGADPNKVYQSKTPLDWSLEHLLRHVFYERDGTLLGQGSGCTDLEDLSPRLEYYSDILDTIELLLDHGAYSYAEGWNHWIAEPLSKPDVLRKYLLEHVCCRQQGYLRLGEDDNILRFETIENCPCKIACAGRPRVWVLIERLKHS